MAGWKQPYLDVMLNLCRQLEEAYGVGNSRTLLAYSVCEFILSQRTLVNQPFIAESEFYRVKILSLDILHNCHFQHSLVIGITYVGGNGRHPGEPACLVSPFSADDLISVVCNSADGDRLDQPEALYGCRQLFERGLVKRHTRLVGIRLDHIYRNPQYVSRVFKAAFRADYFFIDVSNRLAQLVCVRHFSKKCTQAFSKSPGFFAHIFCPLCSKTSLARLR